jgi:ADP-ribose pyrophosphatase YjhB (NUDIX family)
MPDVQANVTQSLDAAMDRPRTYVGAYALCVREGRILLARMGAGGPDAGKWTLPGGGIDWGEDPAVGVLRELGEETGLTGTIRRVAGVYSRTYPRSAERPRDSVQHLGVVFEVDAHDGDLRDEAEGSTDCCAWVPLVEVESLPLVPLAQFGLGLVGG